MIVTVFIKFTANKAESIDVQAFLGENDNPDALWQKLRHATDEGYLLGTSVAKGEKCETDLGNGILGKHAYVYCCCLYCYFFWFF